MQERIRTTYGINFLPNKDYAFCVVTPTEMKFVEADGSDVRVERVREFSEQGRLVKAYLRDKMGVRFVNMPNVNDDLDYLSSLGFDKAKIEEIQKLVTEKQISNKSTS